MRHVTITPNGQKRVLLVQSGTLGLALKQMADTSVNAARAESAAQEAVAAAEQAGSAGALAGAEAGSSAGQASGAEAGAVSGAEAGAEAGALVAADKANKDGSDISSASAWRDALDLGEVATQNVGTTPGTVAAGDDPRLEAVQFKADLDGSNVDAASFRSAIGADLAGNVNLSARASGFQAMSAADRFNQVEEVSIMELLPKARREDVIAGTNTTDLTSYIQAGLTQMQSQGGKIVCPRGQFYVQGTLQSDCDSMSIVGAGPGATTFLTDSATNTMFDFGNSGSARQRNGFSGVGFNSTVARTAGAYLRANKLSDFTLDWFWSGGGFRVLQIDNGAALLRVSRGYMQLPAAGVGIGILANDCTDLHIDRLQIAGSLAAQPFAGIRAKHVSGLWMHDVGAVWSGTPFLLDPDAGQTVQHGFSSNCHWDTSTGVGMDIAPAAGGVVERWESIGDWFATCSLQGLRTGGAGTIRGMQFLGPRAYNNGREGILHGNGTDVAFKEARLAGNSTAGANTYDGFRATAGVSEWEFTGRSGVADGFTNAQRYGARIDAGAGDHYTLKVDGRNNATGQLSDGGTGANKSATTLYAA